MFGLSKKKKKVKIKKENKEPEVKLPAGQVHTMPAKFQITPKKGLSRKIKIIIIVVISLVIIGAGVVFFSIDWSQKSRQQLTSEADLNKNSNQISSEIDESMMVEEEINENIKQQPVNLNEEEMVENTNQGLEGDEEEEDKPDEVGSDYSGVELEEVLVSSQDSDDDGLTDVEEELYQTDKNKPDTDLDGYIDGEEFEKGYSPRLIATKLEDDSELVEKYISNLYHYSVLYPITWRVRSVDDMGIQILFQPPESKEFIDIVILETSDSLEKWYQEFVGQGSEDIPLPKQLNEWQMVRSADQLTVYLGQKELEQIYIITYNPADSEELNFMTTLEMMINSFSSVSEEE